MSHHLYWPLRCSVAAAALLATSLCLAHEDEQFPSHSTAHSFGYLGLGIAQFNLHNEHPALGGKSATGIYLMGGYQLSDYLKFELSSAGASISVGATCDPNLPQACQTLYYPADSAEYFNLLVTIRLALPHSSYPEVQPWLSTGRAHSYYSWDTYAYSVRGSAPFLGAGLDIRTAERWHLRIEVNHTRYEGQDNYGYEGFDGSTTQFTAALVYNFRPHHE